MYSKDERLKNFNTLRVVILELKVNALIVIFS
jgi:hypothetical protein